MDKNTLSNYGWIVIAVLVLSVMIALATPFGQYVEQGVRATTEGLFDTSKNAVNSAFEDLGVQMDDQEFEEGYEVPNGETDESEQLVAGATFTDGTFLTWDELVAGKGNNKYTFGTITNETIGEEVFYTSLKSIVIPDTVTTISNFAFSGCSQLNSVKMSNNLTSIGQSAFSGCSSLTEIVLPNSLVTIESDAFNMCGIKNITIPEKVKNINEYVFADCSLLTNVIFKGDVTNINEYAFSGCTSLSSFTLPSSIEFLGYGIFADCESLTSIQFDGTTTQFYKIETNDWTDYSALTTVVCSNGNINLR